MRLDNYLVAAGCVRSRSQAREYIISGRVTVNGVPARKPGEEVREGDGISVLSPCRFVSRAGEKLERALEVFGVSPEGLSALDIGASTGGFTDCLLKHGAARVCALDVGRGQIDPSLAADGRVTVIEGFNARYLNLSDLPFEPQIVTADLSFISQSLVYPAVSRVLEKGFFISLVKPQFEAGREHIGKGGILRDPDGSVAAAVISRLSLSAAENGLSLIRIADSPIPGGDGNREYLALFERV